MSNRKTDLFLQDILTAISEIEEYTSSISYDEFLQDKKTVQAVIRNLEIIGEAANNLPQEFKEHHS